MLNKEAVPTKQSLGSYCFITYKQREKKHSRNSKRTDPKFVTKNKGKKIEYFEIFEIDFFKKWF